MSGDLTKTDATKLTSDQKLIVIDERSKANKRHNLQATAEMGEHIRSTNGRFDAVYARLRKLEDRAIRDDAIAEVRKGGGDDSQVIAALKTIGPWVLGIIALAASVVSQLVKR